MPSSREILIDRRFIQIVYRIVYNICTAKEGQDNGRTLTNSRQHPYGWVVLYKVATSCDWGEATSVSVEENNKRINTSVLVMVLMIS
jgi:hypothetical protein